MHCLGASHVQKCQVNGPGSHEVTQAVPRFAKPLLHLARYVGHARQS